MSIGTHSGTFHCDEVLACFMLQQLDEFKNHKIVRSRDANVLAKCEIVVDVGSVFDPESKKFDHHQATFNETFNSLRPKASSKNGGNIRLSSAGLIYVYYGERVIQATMKKLKDTELDSAHLKSIYVKVYENFIQEIDGIDNGVPQFDGEPKYSINSHLSNRVKHFNPDWTENLTSDQIDERFAKAQEYVGKEFQDKILNYATSWLPARSIVEEAIKDRFKVHESGEIIELSRFCPWQEHLREVEYENEGIEIKYVIFNGGNDDWRVQCIPVKSGSFVCRKFLKKSWQGIRDEELEKISGIPGIKFVHATGFIGGHKCRDGALKMAVESLKSTE
jgi:uncharacterized UPF0160 family protein